MFSWDVLKAQRNLQKHRVSFEDAESVFLDSHGLDWEDREHSEQELRFKRLGRSKKGQVLLVVYTVRIAYEKETIWIISARQASRKERKAYAR